MSETKYSYILAKGNEPYYSILCIDKNSNIIATIEDVLCDKSAVQKFCDLLNNNQVELCHLEEIYDDYFG